MGLTEQSLLERNNATAMNTWTAFLKTFGGNVGEHNRVTFGDSAGNAEPDREPLLIMDLSYLGLIRVEGDDALSFLTAQFTNDLRGLQADRSQLSGYCNPQGRLIALMRIFRVGDDFFLQTPRSLVDGLIKRLRMFVLRAKVVLSDVSEQWPRIGLAGSEVTSIGQAILDTALPPPEGVTSAGAATLLHIPGPVPRYEVIAPSAQAQTLWSRFAARGRIADDTVWQRVSLRGGIPEIEPATSQQFVPQMVNLELIGGVNFKKGCYPGQEIVARMQYLGKLKRRLYRARLAQDHAPQPGDDLYQGGIDAEHKAGTVVNSVPSPQGGYELLAVLEIAASADIRYGSPKGKALELVNLPYEVPSSA
jgi:folate-binding protein YgfZ